MDKQESRRIRVEIRHALVDVWDPIGIKDEPNAQDEYDTYIGGAFELLKKGGSDEELSAYLWRIIEERIHVHPAKGATQETIKALRRIRMS